MPKVVDAGPYRLFFYSNERDEPPHVHVQRDHMEAKFWLRPVALAGSSGFAHTELQKIERIVIQYENECWEKWHAHFKRSN